MEDTKYVVFKREDWEGIVKEGEYLSGWSPHTENFDFSKWDEKRVDDAVVIRRQDVFAAPALAAYANLILGGTEVAARCGANMNNETVARLMKISEYFMAQAEEAYAESEKKIPD